MKKPNQLIHEVSAISTFLLPHPHPHYKAKPALQQPTSPKPTMLSKSLPQIPNFTLNPKPHPQSPLKIKSFPQIHHPHHLKHHISTSKPRIFTTKATINDHFVSSSELNKSFYELLGISETCGCNEIKQAYKQLARKYHPDVSPPERVREYTERFILVQEAYETLSDPATRAQYDLDMARGLHLAFSARKNREEFLMRNEWRMQFEAQLEELKKKSMDTTSGRNVSWAAQMRQRRSSQTG